MSATAVGAVILLSLPFSAARASDDAADTRHSRHPDSHPLDEISTLSPEVLFSRTQAVLKHFGADDEPEPTNLITHLEAHQSLEGLNRLLPALDPLGAFKRFATKSEDRLRMFQDRDAMKTPDFEVSLSSGARDEVVPAYSRHLRRAARDNAPATPLAGLRIAIDPGHVGGSPWDKRTGKYVEDHRGHLVGEGVITLQTALLLEKELARLGARVMVTRHGFEPVSHLPYASFDFPGLATRLLREYTLFSWFTHLLDAGAPGEKLYRAFDDSPEIKRAFEDSDWERFTDFNEDDLAQRALDMDAFRPDVSLVIHYDSSSPASDPNGLGSPGLHDATKVYVPGAFNGTDFASREDRAWFARHLLDPQPWNDSAALGAAVIERMTSELKLPPAHYSPGLYTTVHPGVFTRNLSVLRHFSRAPIAYAECLFYNEREEFAQLIDTPNPMTIDGENVPYSNRVAQVAHALRDGVLDYVKAYSDRR